MVGLKDKGQVINIDVRIHPVDEYPLQMIWKSCHYSSFFKGQVVIKTIRNPLGTISICDNVMQM